LSSRAFGVTTRTEAVKPKILQKNLRPSQSPVQSALGTISSEVKRPEY